MLKITNINTFYDKSHILQDVSLKVRQGELVGLVGRNGVGKSTTLKSIIGIAPPSSGAIEFAKTPIQGLRPHKIAQLGVGYVPEDRRIFPTLTVRENLMMGIKPGSSKATENSWTIEKMHQLFPILKRRDSQKAGFMSGGEQQMLTIARTLMGNPQLVLIDEPTEGLAPQIVETVIAVIREIHAAGVTVLLVEQSIDVVLELAQKVCVMSKGEIVFEDTTTVFKKRKDIREKYLEV